MAILTNEQLAGQMQIARANDEKERQFLKRNLKFVRNTDDLDTVIYEILEPWLHRELTTDENIVTAETMEDIAQQPDAKSSSRPWFLQPGDIPTRHIPPATIPA